MRHPRRTLTAALALGLMIGACSSDADSTAPPDEDTTATVDDDGTDPAGEDTAPDTVTIARSRFGPPELIVAAGTTVTFENTDPFAHTVTARDDSTLTFDSGELGESELFEVTFDEPGEYAYFCQIHPTMRATVVVE